jgi:hypothetical protein
MSAESLVLHMSRSGELRSFDPSPVTHFYDPVPLVVIAVGTTLWRQCRSNNFPRFIKVSAGVTALRVGDIRRHFYEIEHLHQGGRL